MCSWQEERPGGGEEKVGGRPPCRGLRANHVTSAPELVPNIAPLAAQPSSWAGEGRHRGDLRVQSGRRGRHT